MSDDQLEKIVRYMTNIDVLQEHMRPTSDLLDAYSDSLAATRRRTLYVVFDAIKQTRDVISICVVGTLDKCQGQ